MAVFTLGLEKELQSNDMISSWSAWSETTLLNSAMGEQSFVDSRQKEVSKHFTRDW